MTRWTQKWGKLIPGPVHSTAPITRRSMLWQPIGVSINQPAAVLSNSLPTHTRTHAHAHSVPSSVIADHHTWQLDHRVSFLDWQVLNPGSKQGTWTPQQWEKVKTMRQSTPTTTAISQELSASESDSHRLKEKQDNKHCSPSPAEFSPLKRAWNF